MAHKISDETIEYVGILAKLELSGQEKEDAKADMEKMLDYIDTLNELDTEGIEPMSHVFPIKNSIPRRCGDERGRKQGYAGQCAASEEQQFQSTKRQSVRRVRIQ